MNRKKVKYRRIMKTYLSRYKENSRKWGSCIKMSNRALRRCRERGLIRQRFRAFVSKRRLKMFRPSQKIVAYVASTRPGARKSRGNKIFRFPKLINPSVPKIRFASARKIDGMTSYIFKSVMRDNYLKGF